MPSLQEMAKKPSAFAGGHRMCAGCPAPIITKMLTRVTDYEIVAGNATGCLEVASSIFPYSAWNIPWIHTAFELGGDGGTYDIGLQSLSGAMERGHDLLYICYDNGAYMNTGIQRSSATPMGAATTTTPEGEFSPGRKGNRKDLTKIMVAHNIGYAAQASIHNPVDLSNKIKKAIEHEGAAFLNVLCPCIPGWRIDPDMGVEAAKIGVETRYWPLYEVENGKYTINYKPKETKPVTDWIFMQGRFRHLKNPKWSSVIEDFQKEIDRNWEWLLKQEGI